MKENYTTNDKHNTYGGLIYASDFDTEHYYSHNIASRIVEDWIFDRNCRKKILKKKK